MLVLCWSLGQAVAATNVPRAEVGARTPIDVGLTYRDVEFPATDGVRLSGWYVPSRNGAVVLLLHGAGSTRSYVLSHAVVLARHGYGVLLFDARGHGRSSGRAMDFGWFGDRDIGGAVDFLRQQPEIDDDRLAAVGMSMGGEQAIGAAARIHAIGAVVADESRAGRYIRSGSPETVELWIVPDTGHTDALDTHPEEWEARVVGFLDDALGFEEGVIR